MRVSRRPASLGARWPTARERGCILALTVALAALPGRLCAQGDALTLAEILEMRRAGVSTRQILRSTQEYCVAFRMTDSVTRELVASGADAVLLDGIRASCLLTPPMQLPPGVLLDDDFKAMRTLGQLAAIDHLCTAHADSGRMRVENRRRDRGCGIGYPFELEGDANLRIELTVAELGAGDGATAVLGLGMKSGSSDQYSFSITAPDRLELCMTVGGQCRLLFKKRVAPLQAGPASENRMAVEIRSREIVLYINGERVGTHITDGPVAGGLSVGVGARTTAVFSRLRVHRVGAVASSQ